MSDVHQGSAFALQNFSFQIFLNGQHTGNVPQNWRESPGGDVFLVLLWIEIIHLNGLIFFHTTEPFRIDFHFLNKPQTVNLCLFISVMRFLLGYIWASGRETFCEVLFIKNATATCIKRLYGEAFTKWLDTGRLPKMAVTSNCKQFFFFLNQQSYSTYNKYTNHLK